MAIKNVYLKKKIGSAIFDIYPHTDAAITAYTKGSGQDVTQTTVAAELAALATGLAGVITEQTVDNKISTATTNLYNQIMGFTDAEGGHTINEAYDTLKEVADYLSGDGGAAATLAALSATVGDANGGLVKKVADLETTVGNSTSGLVKDTADLKTTVGDSTSGLVKDVADNASAIGTLETTVGDTNGGLVKDVADNASAIDTLETTVGDSTSGLVKDVAGLKTTVGDNTAGLVKDVADLKTTTGTQGGVYVVANEPAVADADENSLYIVVDE